MNMPVMLAGDYNVMPTELDVYKPRSWVNDALFLPEVESLSARLVSQGWTDALRNKTSGRKNLYILGLFPKCIWAGCGITN